MSDRSSCPVPAYQEIAQATQANRVGRHSETTKLQIFDGSCRSRCALAHLAQLTAYTRHANFVGLDGNSLAQQQLRASAPLRACATYVLRAVPRACCSHSLAGWLFICPLPRAKAPCADISELPANMARSVISFVSLRLFRHLWLQ
jgi:hypothetical protein